jgi:hypothetical protein
MFGQKHHNVIAPYPNNAPPNSEEQYMPMDPILQRDLNARDLAGIVRFVLGLAVAVAVFFILVFGILGAVADALGDALGLHHNYPDVVGRH